jgi:hypothetical protein
MGKRIVRQTQNFTLFPEEEEDGEVTTKNLDVVFAALTGQDIGKAVKDSIIKNSFVNTNAYYAYGKDVHDFGLPTFTRTREEYTLDETKLKELLATYYVNYSADSFVINDTKYSSEGISPGLNANKPALINLVRIHLQRFCGLGLNDVLDLRKAYPLFVPRDIVTFGNELNWFFVFKDIRIESDITRITVDDTAEDAADLEDTKLYAVFDYYARANPEDINEWEIELPIEIFQEDSDPVNITSSYLDFEQITRQQVPHVLLATYSEINFSIIDEPNSIEILDQTYVVAKDFYIDSQVITRPDNAPYIEDLLVLTNVTSTNSSDVFPICPLIIDGIRFNDNDTVKDLLESYGKNFYGKTKTLAAILGLPFDNIISSIEGDKNKKFIKLAYIYLGVSLRPKNKYEAEYLFDFLDSEITEDTSSLKYEMYLNTPNAEWDVLKRVTLSSISRSVYSGELPEEVLTSGLFLDGYVVYNKEETTYEATEDGSVQIPVKYYTTSLYKKTGTSSHSLITYANPTEINSVNGKLREANIPRIPIVKSYFDAFSFRSKKDLLNHSFTCTLAIRAKIDEPSTFEKILPQILQIGAIVIMVYSFGTASSISAALLQIAVTLAITYALTEIFKFIADKVGGDLGKVLAVAAVIATIYVASQYGYMGQMNTVEGAIAATNATVGAYASYTEVEMDRLQKEAKKFDKKMDSMWKELEEARKSLENIKDPELFALLQDLPEDFGILLEEPQEFYYRTKYVRNPGILTIQNSKSFVRRKLELPDYIKNRNVVV